MSISSLFLKIQQLFLFPSKQYVHQTLAKFDLFHLVLIEIDLKSFLDAGILITVLSIYNFH